MEEIKMLALILDAGAKQTRIPGVAATLRAMRDEAVRLVASTPNERCGEYAILAFEVLSLPMEGVS